MRIKKSLIEAKFIANSEDALKMADKMGKEDIVKIVDESDNADGSKLGSELVAGDVLTGGRDGVHKIIDVADNGNIYVNVTVEINSGGVTKTKILKFVRDNIYGVLKSNNMEEAIVGAPKKSLNNPKIEKFVNDLNVLIKSAIDSDGDPIAVVDASGTWQEPYVYLPIEYVNGKLKITSKSQYKNEPEVDVISRQNMEYDGVPTLRLIKKLYTAAVKKQAKPQMPVQEDEHDIAGRAIGYGQPEPELGDADWEELYKVMNQDVKNSDNEQV